MHASVASRLGEIEALCRQHGVRRLWLFGSALNADFDPVSSDVDFVVEFLPVPRGGLDDVYFSLLLGLEKLLDRRVDLVEASAIRNRYFRDSVEASKVPVYAAA